MVDPMMRRSTVLVLLGAILALAPLAHASPPDQTWIAGLYDDGDYDDVILLVTASAGAIQADPVPALTPVATVVGFVCPTAERGSPEPPRLADFSRAPPLS
jgi:hypothetical protein